MAKYVLPLTTSLRHGHAASVKQDLQLVDAELKPYAAYMLLMSDVADVIACYVRKIVK